jgi:UDP-N-acetylmuramoyl-L-alanyl-D-glutamate--2,6-diaminopimelate ligase
VKHTYSVRANADFTCRIISNEISGLHLKLDGEELHSRLTGEFNAWNLLAVYATARLLGIGKSEALQAISLLSHVNGRFELLYAEKRNLTAVVDYAHTPDAVEKVLETLRSMLKKGASVITVIGCGGDRDKAKRPLMAASSAKLSNRVVLTSDNPRSEDPNEIIREMEAGLSPEMKKKVLSITDRKEAIRTAVMLAADGDVVLVAGKGHETYQEIKGVKYPFDDKAIITETFQNLND